MAHEVFVGVAEDVVVFGAVFREVEGGVFEDGDEVAEFLDFVGAFAEFVGVVEIGEVGAGEAGVGGDEGRDDLGVDFVADVGLPLRADMSAKLAPLGMVTGGAKSSEWAYLSEMYLMKSIKRT